MGTDDAQIQEVLDDLLERVARLETGRAVSTPVDPARLDRLLFAGDAAELESRERVVAYAGSGAWGDEVVAWRRQRSWNDVLAAEPGPLAAVFSALANPMRIRIVTSLAQRALTTRELLEQLREPTTGQLFHHLKDLLIAGVIFQPVRGTYAIRHQHVIPLLAAMSVALDLGHHTADEEELQ